MKPTFLSEYMLQAENKENRCEGETTSSGRGGGGMNTA